MDEELRTQTLDPQQAIDWQQLAEQATRTLSDGIDELPTTYQNGKVSQAFGLMQQAFEACGKATGTTYHKLSPGVPTSGTIGKGNWP